MMNLRSLSVLASRSTAASRRSVMAVAPRRALSSSSDNSDAALHYPIVPESDHGSFREYSVIHTDRSLNLMSAPFGQVMRDLNVLLKHTYNANKVVIIPGSGTFGMEAVARQFVPDGQKAMVLRNGWFSYRWTEILDMAFPGNTHTVLKAVPTPIAGSTSTTGGEGLTHFRPAPVKDVVAKIREERPKAFFCPHVETSTGMMLPDDYIKEIASAVHDVGGIMVLDCIASGTVWCDMKQNGVDVIISAPQKGWTGTPCSALVCMSEKAVEVMNAQEPNTETSFSLSLKRWSAIMDAYEKGGFAYHTTMPTDSLRDFHEISVETVEFGLEKLKQEQLRMGWTARAILDSKGLVSVAAPGFQAPGVLVYYSPNQNIDNPVMMQQFKHEGLQIAMGVPWRIDEPAGLKTFRIGLFGLDKLKNVESTLRTMETALDNVLHELPVEKVA